MAILTCYDAAYPLANPPATDVVLIYSGGNATHIWTAAEIAAQKARFRLPCWVRSNPVQANSVLDANAMVAWLHAHKVPAGVATVLDLETAVAPAYVNSYASILHAAGYRVLPYGSTSTLFNNPKCDGYFSAEPGAKSIDARCVATQYGYEGTYDLSWIEDTVSLWDTAPPAPKPKPKPLPAPTTPITVHIVGATEAAEPGVTRAVQSLLLAKFNYDLGTTGPHKNGIDGVFGAKTEAAVKAFQTAHKIAPNGLVTNTTWVALLEA